MTTIRDRCAALAILLFACAATAAAQSVREATTPTSTIDVGPAATSDGSFKAGEFNGLQKQGLLGIGVVDWRGGGAFDSDNAMRWRVKGNDLGLDSRSITAEAGRQGVYRFFAGYDQLLRNRSDSYQSFYNGLGTTTLTLPGSWLIPTVVGANATNSNVNIASARGLVPSIGTANYIDIRTTSPTFGGIMSPLASQNVQVVGAAASNLPLMRPYDLSTTRYRVDVGLSYNFDQQWGIDALFRPEHKSGAKPMGTVSRNTGGDISLTIPDVIDSNTNQVDVRMNYRGEKGFAQAGYVGSFYRNNVASMSWQNWASGNGAAATLNTMSSTPGNSFNQITATGGVNFSRTTKLVVNGSYGRNTQNDTFLTDSTTVVVPVNSLNGVVVNEAVNARFTAKPSKSSNFTATYKFDNRDNQSAVHIFQYADAGEAPAANANFVAAASNPLGAVLAQNANANRPYSRKSQQADAEIDVGVAKHQWLNAAYDFQRVNRECNNTWISCADAAITNENTVRAEWRVKAADVFTGRIGYAYSSRRTPFYNENAYLALVPYAGVSPATATGGASAYSFMLGNGWTGYGPSLGYAATTGNMNLFFPSNNAMANALYANNNRISELPGMRRYYVADRDRNKLRLLGTWQAGDAVTLQAGADYNTDHYPDATYGLQDSHNWDVNADASYAAGTDVSFNVFYSYEDFRNQSAGNTYTANSNTGTITGGRPEAIGLAGNSCDSYTTLLQRNNNNKLDPCLNWYTNRLDNVHTIGVGLLWKEVGDKPFDLTSNVIYSRARSDNSVTGGNWANNPVNGPGGPATTIAAYFIGATALPTVSTDSAEFHLNGVYRIDARQALRLQYVFMHMTSADWIYESMQLGSMATALPTSEQPFNYNVHVFGVSYTLSF